MPDLYTKSSQVKYALFMHKQIHVWATWDLRNALLLRLEIKLKFQNKLSNEVSKMLPYIWVHKISVLIASARSEGSDESARSLVRAHSIQILYLPI